MEKAAEMDLEHKKAYIDEKITLADYLYAQASNIRFIPYLDEEDIAASELVDAQISQADSNFDSFEEH